MHTAHNPPYHALPQSQYGIQSAHHSSNHAPPPSQYGMPPAHDFCYHAPPQSQYATYAAPLSAYQALQPPYSTGITLGEPARSQITSQPLVSIYQNKPSQRRRRGRRYTYPALAQYYTKAIAANPPQHTKAVAESEGVNVCEVGNDVMPARQPCVDVRKGVGVMLEFQPRVDDGNDIVSVLGRQERIDDGKDLRKLEPGSFKPRLVGPKRHNIIDPDIGAVNDTAKRVKVENPTIDTPSTRPLARISSMMPSLGWPRALGRSNNTVYFIPSSEDRAFDMNAWKLLPCDAQVALSGAHALSGSFAAVGLECTIDSVQAIRRLLIVTNKSFKNDYYAVEQLQAIAEHMSFRLNVVYFDRGEYRCRNMGTKTSDAQIGSTQSGNNLSGEKDVHIFCGGGWLRWQGMAEKYRHMSSTIRKTLDISFYPVYTAGEKKKRKTKASSDEKTLASKKRPNKKRTSTLRPRKLDLIYTAFKGTPSEDDSNQSEWTPSSSDTDF